MGVTLRGVKCWQWRLAVVLACTERLVKIEEVGPKCVVVDICQGCDLRGVLDMDKHCFLDSSGLAVAFLMHDVELGWDPTGVLLWCCAGGWGRGLLNVPGHGLPVICQTPQCSSWNNGHVATGIGR